ncbi:MAG: CRTAC1 family protein [Sandaracinaceae bacterium]
MKWLACFLVVPIVACDGAHGADAGIDGAVHAMCRPPGVGWSPGQAAFVERTDAWGLAGLRSAGVTVADLDGDGWPDLVVSPYYTQTYDRLEGHVFFNRPGAGAGRTFEDRSEASGLFRQRDGGGFARQATMVRLIDADNDGDVDAFTGTFIVPDPNDPREPYNDGAELSLNDGTGTFTLTPVQVPVWHPIPTMSDGVFFDQDRDGRLDLALAFWFEQPNLSGLYGEHPIFLRGDGAGGFVDQTLEVGISLGRSLEAFESGTHVRPLFGLAMCDLDDDGRQDLVGAAYGRMYNELFHDEGGTFVEIGATTLVGSDDRRDFSDDNTFRCYCASHAGAPECAGAEPPYPNYGCRPGWAPGVSDQPTMLGGNTFSHHCADLDNDGDLDLFETNIRHPDVRTASDPSEIIVNESTPGALTFARPGRDAMGLTPPVDLTRIDEGGQSGAVFDFDNDGRLDVLLSGSPYPNNRAWLFHQRTEGSLSFEWIGDSAGFSHACPMGAAVADFDHDGDLDVVVGTQGCNDPVAGDYPPETQPVRFYENVSNEHNWIAIRLAGDGAGGANRMGIGARVRLTAGGVTQTRVIQPSFQQSSTEAIAWFGLGDACTVDGIEVRWPDASLSVVAYEGVVANQRVELRPDGTTTYLP